MAAKLPGIVARLRAAAGLVLGRPVAQNYNSTAFSPARGRVPHTSPADARQEMSSRDRVEIVRICRYLEKNNPFIAASVNASLTYACGDGFRFVPQSTSVEFNKAARQAIAEVMERPEISGKYNGRDLLRLALRAQKVDGELFFIKTLHPDGMPALQALECHRITQPDNAGEGWVDGIKFDRQGRPLAYAVKNDQGKFQYFRAESVIHFYNPDRFTGTRGVSPYQVAINTVRDRDEILLAERVAVKAFSQKGFVLHSQAGEFDEADAGILGGRRKAGTSSAGENCGTSADDVADAFGGQSIALKPGEDLKAFEFPNRPSPVWLGFDAALQRDAALGTGLPLDFLTDPTKINGTVARMVIKQAEKSFEADKVLLDQKLLRPFIRYALGVLISQGRLPAVQGWEKIAFQYPRPISVDLGRDVGAAIREVELGIRNPRDLIEENQDDYEAQVIERLDDFAWAKAEAEKRGLPFDLVFKFTNQAPTPIATPAARAAAAPMPAESEVEESEEDEKEDAAEEMEDETSPTSEDGQELDADGNEPEGPQINNPIA